MKLNKRILSLMLALVLIFGMVPTALATDGGLTRKQSSKPTEATEAPTETTAPASEPTEETTETIIIPDDASGAEVPTVYETLMEAESVEEMYAEVLSLMQSNPTGLNALTVEEISSLFNRIAELDPEGDDVDYVDLIDTLTYLPAMQCPECGEFGTHAEDCIKNIEILPASGTFASSSDYRAYRYVSDKDGGVRENENFIVNSRDSSIGNIPILGGEISYAYSDVIIGMLEAESLECKVPVSLVAPASARVSGGYGDCGSDPSYPGVDTCVLAEESTSRALICNSDEYYVIYRNIGTYDSKQNINLKVSVFDYELSKDTSALGNGKEPIITLRISDGKPGVEVAGVSWIELKYEFLDDNNNPITVSGNTTYYDVDGSQLVHLNGHDGDSSCKGIYVTDNCLLYAGTFSSSSNNYSMPGIGVYEKSNLGYPRTNYPANDLNVVDAVAFTEIFTASTMYRTFSFIQNRTVDPSSSVDYKTETDIVIDGVNKYHSDEWAGGLIFHSGMPVIRRTGDLTVSKYVPEGRGNRDKEFSFTITLSEKLTKTYGDLQFVNGVANFTLKHGESVTATGLYEFLTYEIVESNNTNYKVIVNGTELSGAYSGALVGDGSTSSGTTVNFLNNDITFTNEYRLADLVIDKEVTDQAELALDPNQSFLFHVTGTSNGEMDPVDLYVTILGDGQCTIKNLPVGNYTVQEMTNWSWRYSLTTLHAVNNNLIVSNTETNPTDSIDFELYDIGETIIVTNDRVNPYWLDGEHYAKNVFTGVKN